VKINREFFSWISFILGGIVMCYALILVYILPRLDESLQIFLGIGFVTSGMIFCLLAAISCIITIVWQVVDFIFWLRKSKKV